MVNALDRIPMNYRNLFSLDDEVVYFNAAFATPHPIAVIEAGQRALMVRSRPWEIMPEHFFADCEILRERVAQNFGTATDNVAFIPAVSYGMELIARNTNFTADQNILIPEGDFPSTFYPWQKACQRTGAQLILVPRPANGNWTEAILSHINPKTAAVVVPQTDWSNGTHFDLLKIRQASRAVGALMINDISQSFCAAPFSMDDVDADFVLSVGYKWQLGPYGLSYMAANPRFHNLEPLENNWINRKNSCDFTKLTHFQDEYLPGARRFDCGQRSQFQHVPMALAAQNFISEISVEKIHEYIRGLNQILKRELLQMGLVVADDQYRTGHLLGFSLPNIEASGALALKLKAAGLALSLRDHRFFRISPHIYNTEAEIERFLDILKTSIKNLAISQSKSDPKRIQPALASEFLSV